MSKANDNQKRDWSKVQRRSTRQVNVRLTAEEAARLNQITQAAGISASGYMKAAAFNRPPPRAAPRVDANATMLRQLLGQMGKLGSNANQIAKGVNRNSLEEYRAVRSSLAAIEEELKEMRLQLRAALGVGP